MVDEIPMGKYRIEIDKRWDLEDLYKFPRAYEQVYFALFSLFPHDDEGTRERIDRAYASFPWNGGYSAVNFYNNLKYILPKGQRPAVASIQYASPGWIELFHVVLPVALGIAAIVKAVCSSFNNANNTYTNIHKGLTDRKMLRIEVERKEIELLEKHMDFVKKSNLDMAQILQLQPSQIAVINAKTGSALKTLKIFLSIFRRIKTLAEYQTKGKADLGDPYE
jgi:hypothetical protein